MTPHTNRGMRGTPPAADRIIGAPGSSLEAWAGTRDSAIRVGRAGELKTAEVLNELVQIDPGLTVMHDLRLPARRLSINIDHLVITKRTVHIIDSKMWKPGLYWTWRGEARRRDGRFTPAETRAHVLAAQTLTGYLRGLSVSFNMAEPVAVIWSSSPHQRTNVSLLTLPGARAVSASSFQRRPRRSLHLPPRHLLPPADVTLINALRPLVNER